MIFCSGASNNEELVTMVTGVWGPKYSRFHKNASVVQKWWNLFLVTHRFSGPLMDLLLSINSVLKLSFCSCCPNKEILEIGSLATCICFDRVICVVCTIQSQNLIILWIGLEIKTLLCYFIRWCSLQTQHNRLSNTLIEVWHSLSVFTQLCKNNTPLKRSEIFPEWKSSVSFSIFPNLQWCSHL